MRPLGRCDRWCGVLYFACGFVRHSSRVAKKSGVSRSYRWSNYEMKAQTRAAILTAPRKFEITDRARPVAGTDEVVVRIAATAVCHTDLEIYTGRHPGVRYPVIMGHEATGTIDSVGPQVTGLKPGQNVLI